MLGFPSWGILYVECFVNRELAKLLSRGFKNHRTGRPGRVSDERWVSKNETQTSVGVPLSIYNIYIYIMCIYNVYIYNVYIYNVYI